MSFPFFWPSRTQAYHSPLAGYRWHLWLMLTPFLAGALLLIGLPALMTFRLAFTRYDAMMPPVWNGWANFAEIAQREIFWIAAGNTLAFAGATALLQVLGSLGLALLLHPLRCGVQFYRSSVYLISVLPDVAYALIWLWLFNPLYGPINLVLGQFGLPQPAWLVDPATALPSLVIMAALRVGEGMLLLIAARQALPPGYFHAAMLDGAGRWAVFRHILWPLLMPWLLLLFVRDIVVAAHSTFTAVYMMTGGGPGYATMLLPYLIYEEAFSHLRIGQAAAMLTLLFAVIALVVGFVYRRLSPAGYTDDL